MSVNHIRPALAGLTVIATVLLIVGPHAAVAQNPFGAGPSAPPEAMGGVVGWALRQQALYYRELTALIRAARQNGGIAYGLLGLSFAYGVFHAAGPGHGKAVISSYLFANGETWRRGVALSFAAALLQSLVAVGIVALFAAVLGSTAQVIGGAARDVEIASYLMVIAVGLRLAWVKGHAFAAEWRQFRERAIVFPTPTLAMTSPAGAAAPSVHFTVHVYDRDDHSHHDGCLRDAHHDHDDQPASRHGACDGCGHAHGPQPEEVAGPGGWRRGLSAVAAAGLRPCSGAIIVLVFALTQDLFWTGVAATFAMGLGTAITVAALASFALVARSAAAWLAGGRGAGTLALRGVEIAAALAIVLFGALLLTGHIASERMLLV
jgi:ABC-type nickel/cobalt efflux system permease component RcnA